ncbi:hypothetical protein OS190_13310 [Sulfitobacter sp. F26204]|uniref:hypothetical protein n=1 Tax=Sulfitobacter sp. F26204 TaxID=2996014 RepID=UPI00225E5F9B|nr:hypothetical protein [Sulfitobacter sp. F26204]MCX7560549.1 hypothetical protein [Sulfitobacter sp. F26204]
MTAHQSEFVVDSHQQSGGLHLIYDAQSGHRPSARRRLVGAVERTFEKFGWQSLRLPSGKRLCAALDGSPVPPVSISYSGPFALIAVSSDWRSIGVDLELTRTSRLMRYDIIEAEYLDQRSPDPMATFVRAEAWAKALEYGFAFGPSFFFKGSTEPGARDGGKRVDDLDLGSLDLNFDGFPHRLQAAACVDIAAPPLSIHSFVRIE